MVYGTSFWGGAYSWSRRLILTKPAVSCPWTPVVCLASCGSLAMTIVQSRNGLIRSLYMAASIMSRVTPTFMPRFN